MVNHWGTPVHMCCVNDSISCLVLLIHFVLISTLSAMKVIQLLTFFVAQLCYLLFVATGVDLIVHKANDEGETPML